MNDKAVAKFRGVVRDEINSAIKPIAKKLDTLWDQVIEVTTDLSEVKETLKSHTASLHRIEERSSEDIKKLYKRLTTVEDQAGIISPPELTIAR